jgi:hypothetical protein
MKKMVRIISFLKMSDPNADLSDIIQYIEVDEESDKIKRNKRNDHHFEQPYA